MQMPSLGRIVIYRLSLADAERINSRRLDQAAFRSSRKAYALTADEREAGMVQAPDRPDDGLTGHVGNTAAEGMECPAMVVRTFGGETVNLQVFLDGNDTQWVTSAQPGDRPGTWAWPTITK